MDNLDNIQEQENGLYQILDHSFSFQAYTIALSSFYRKTNISGTISYSYVPAQDSVLINLSFSRLPTDDEYKIFLEDLKIAERFVIGNSFLSYIEDINEQEELEKVKENFKNETKLSSIYLDINMTIN